MLINEENVDPTIQEGLKLLKQSLVDGGVIITSNVPDSIDYALNN